MGSYEDQTKAELEEQAEARGLENVSGLKKADLIGALEDDDAAVNATPETPEPVEPDLPVPAKGSDAYETPSGYAAAESGGDPDKYAELRAKKRYG